MTEKKDGGNIMRKTVSSVLALAVTALLVLGAQRLLAVPSAPPLYEGTPRRVLRIWLIEGWTGSDAFVTKQAAAFEKEFAGVSVRVRRAQPEELQSAEAVLPDLLLYEPGVLSDPQALLTPVVGETGIRPEIEASGRFRDVLYGVPLCMGGYCALTNTAYADGAWAQEAIAGAMRKAEGKKQRQVYALQIPSDGARCFSAAALCMGEASEGILSRLPEGAAAPDALGASAQKAYQDFTQGSAAILLCTQREVRRFAALREAGKGFEFTVTAPERPYTDMLLLGSVLKGAPQGELAVAFLSRLLLEENQKALGGYGLFPVVEGVNPFSERDTPLLHAVFAPLRSSELLCANAYGWGAQQSALSQAAQLGLRSGGVDIGSVPFY